MNDPAYDLPAAELDHAYGPNVRILSDPWALSLVAQLSHPEVTGRRFHALLERAYQRLAQAIIADLPTAQRSLPTRMAGAIPGAAATGAMVDPTLDTVVVDVARAGMVPSHILQLELLHVLRDDNVRVDHIYMQRVADEAGRVTGVKLDGSKIGGPVAGRTVIVPDPMGATGSSIARVLDWYATGMDAAPRQLITAHLILTPEYLKKVTTAFPDAKVYALRLDRGLSAPDVLASRPGERWDDEVGLNAHDYIVPGAGGLGELINNAFV